ncbi:MAG TPA: asparagine synthase (glutamine-hydrolyzing) [Candidatus Thermoplasmatota archaeon]|nr:asparagine synthase (glutamine-hydrolyzing) [Candidatus Thermoplasmatota archaeon]
MCGIAGLLADDAGSVRRMLDAEAHRGPDGWDLWADGPVTLGHRRLAIIDVQLGRQPMASTDGRFTIVYNGEVYNHRLLREELSAEGARFHTASDTEVILEAYRAWGPGAFVRLEGMFAFALWDAQRRELVLARDRWGIKPLYHTSAGGRLAFASELKALLADPDVPRTLDRQAIVERAVLEFTLGGRTPFAAIQAFPPGAYAIVRPGDASVDAQPFPPLPAAGAQDPAVLARAVAQAFEASVEAQLEGERPIATVLSGGLDSTLVAHVQRRRLGLDVPLYSVADRADNPDLVAARAFAQQAGAPHDVHLATEEEVRRDLPALVAAHEGFHYTEAFFLPLFRRLARHGPVAVCGQGSDELWGGYARYRDPQALLATRLARLAEAGHPDLPRLQARLAAAHADGSRLARFDQGPQLHDFQLRLVDGTSMASGVEVRVPFLSSQLQALSDGAGWDWKVRGDVEKWVLRKAASQLGLPDAFAWRPKLPAGRSTLASPIASLEGEAARRLGADATSRGPWAGVFQRPMELLAFHLWHEVFVHRAGRRGNLSLDDVEVPA